MNLAGMFFMRKTRTPLVLTEDRRIELERLARTRNGAANISLRARMMLCCAAGESNRRVAMRFGVKPHTVGTWRKRFEQDGCKGLRDEPRSGRPAMITAAIKQRIVHAVCRKPPKGLEAVKKVVKQKIWRAFEPLAVSLRCI